MSSAEELYKKVVEDIKNNAIKLPILPDVAMKVHTLLDNPRSNINDVVKVISLDAAISARLIQIANSPLFRGRNPIEDLQTAVMRLGNSMVRSIVTVMLVEESHQAKSPLIQDRIAKLWKHNTQVAALSYVLARNYTSLRPDEAMLAGLLHDIGILPLLEYASNYPELINNEPVLNAVLRKAHPLVGKMILTSWSFPQSFIDVAAKHEDLSRKSELLPELVDVVIVANLHSTISAAGPRPKSNWTEIPAFQTLGLTPEESLKSLKNAGDEIKEIMRLFKA